MPENQEPKLPQVEEQPHQEAPEEPSVSAPVNAPESLPEKPEEPDTNEEEQIAQVRQDLEIPVNTVEQQPSGETPQTKEEVPQKGFFERLKDIFS